jgi:hypothetical protein
MSKALAIFQGANSIQVSTEVPMKTVNIQMNNNGTVTSISYETLEKHKETQEVPSVPLQCARILKDYCKGYKGCHGCKFRDYEGYCAISVPISWTLEDIT